MRQDRQTDRQILTRFRRRPQPLKKSLTSSAAPASVFATSLKASAIFLSGKNAKVTENIYYIRFVIYQM